MNTAKTRLAENSKLLWEHTKVARSSVTRLIGLLNRDSLTDHEALLLSPAKQVHTWFMKFSIDVVFLSQDHRVLKIETLKPWKISTLLWEATSILETAAGSTHRLGLQVGDKLEFNDD